MSTQVINASLRQTLYHLSVRRWVFNVVMYELTEQRRGYRSDTEGRCFQLDIWFGESHALTSVKPKLVLSVQLPEERVIM